MRRGRGTILFGYAVALGFAFFAVFPVVWALITSLKLERDIITLDLREPGRAFARLSADAADARAEKLAAKPKKGEKT